MVIPALLFKVIEIFMTSLVNHPNHIDASAQAPKSIVETQVLVVGTGAGGGIAAEVFARAGMTVVMLEEGPLKTRQDFKMREAEAYPDLYQEATARKTKDKGIGILQGRSVGGSTTVNWTSSFRTPDETLSYWQQAFNIRGLSPDEMKPWFSHIEQKLNMSPWQMPPNANNQVLADGAYKLGWSSKVIPRNVKGCANLGYCGMGCPLDAKQSMLVTSIPAAMVSGARLFSRARCEKIIPSAHRVHQVLIRVMDEYGQPTKQTFTIQCDYLVLSAGAIGTPSIMLRSQLPDPHKLIGSRTFLHPVSLVAAQMPQPVLPFSGAPQSIYCDEFLWRDGVNGKLGYKLEVPPVHPLLGSVIMPVHGAEHSDIMSQLPHLHATLALMRDGFHEQSQGGQVELDSSGYPLLDYPLNDYLWDGVAHAMLSMAELQFAAGAKRVRPLHFDSQWINSWGEAKEKMPLLKHQLTRTVLHSAHVMGGARIGDNPQTSVVDNQGKFHHLDNLWVLDGSLFPTSLGVNPQLSIYAIVAKLASELANRIANQ